MINALENASDKVSGTGTTLTDNEIKYIVKVIKPLKNKWILLKGNTGNITSQEGRFLNFLRPLMTARLPLMKTVLTPLGKNVLLPFRLISGISAAAQQFRRTLWIRNYSIYNFEWRNESYNENS